MVISICTNVLYCPGQAPMGAHSSSAKIWGWVVTRRRCLNGSTITAQGPTPDAKLGQSTCTVGSSVLCRGQPDSGKSCIVLQRGWLVASLLSFCSVQSSLAVREICAADEELCEQGHGQVCAKLWCLMSWRPKCIRTIAAMWTQLTYLWIHYARI